MGRIDPRQCPHCGGVGEHGATPGGGRCPEAAGSSWPEKKRPGGFETIYDWTAKRVANAITIDGRTAEGNPRKITGVAFIVLEPDRIRAMANGRNYLLAKEPRR